MDKILRIDMGAEGGPAATVEPVGEYAGLGGRAMTSIVVSKEVDPLCHPLSAANKLVFAPGLLTGTAASTSGRISVGCKSPLTGGIKEANAGGQAGQVLARLGYAAVIVEGEARRRRPVDDQHRPGRRLVQGRQQPQDDRDLRHGREARRRVRRSRSRSWSSARPVR